MIYGALVSLAQWDLKRLIAYSSVSHMGYFILGLAAARSPWLPGYGRGHRRRGFDSRAIALNGAVLQMVNHGIDYRRPLLPGRRYLRANPYPRSEGIWRSIGQAAGLLRRDDG